MEFHDTFTYRDKAIAVVACLFWYSQRSRVIKLDVMWACIRAAAPA